MKMTTKKIFVVTLTATVLHFIFTSALGYYIAVQTGTQMGQVVASGLIEADKKGPQEPGKDTTEIYQNMKKKIDGINDPWKIPSLLIALPAKPLMNPFLVEIRKNQLKKIISKEITREQFRTQWRVFGYVINLVNSISFGLIVYLMLRILKHYEKKKER